MPDAPARSETAAEKNSETRFHISFSADLRLQTRQVQIVRNCADKILPDLPLLLGKLPVWMAKRDWILGLRLTGKAEIRKINQRWRQHDRTTNVLAFFSPPPPSGWPRGLVAPLGDIVLSVPQLAQEARQLGLSFADRAAHLMTHGALHLLGYTHDSPVPARLMERAETFILTKRGFSNPWQCIP